MISCYFSANLQVILLLHKGTLHSYNMQNALQEVFNEDIFLFSPNIVTIEIP